MYDLLKNYVIETLLILFFMNFMSSKAQIICIGLWGLSTVLLLLLFSKNSKKNKAME